MKYKEFVYNFRMQTSTKNNHEKTYLWWKDKKLFGTMLLIIIVSFQIFAFLEIPFMSTIHGYTVGMLLGFYNPLFYIFVGYIALLLMTNNKFHLPKWIKLKWSTYWIIAFSIVFISASGGYYQVNSGWLVIGSKSWVSFSKWFADFTEKNNAWLPANTNGGVIGIFLYAFFAMLLSGIGAFIVAILSILVPLSLLFTGSAWGLYRKIIRKQMLSKKYHNNHKKDNNKMLISQTSNAQKNVQETYQEKTGEVNKKRDDSEKKPNKNESSDELPFDDPFN